MRLTEKNEFFEYALPEKNRMGDKIAISGQIQTRSYEVNGEKRYATEVIADEVEFVVTKNKGEANDTPKELTEIEDDDLPF